MCIRDSVKGLAPAKHFRGTIVAERNGQVLVAKSYGMAVEEWQILSLIHIYAQMSEGKEKPPMYSYVSFWNIPRAQWADMAKEDAANQKLLDLSLIHI